MLHRKFDKCQQGTNYVWFNDYQLRNYCCRVNVSKDDEDITSRFLKWLRADIKEWILLQIFASREYYDVAKIALEIKLAIKRERKQVLKRFEWMQEHHESQSRQDQEFDRFILPKLQYESSLSKQDHFIDFSSPKDSNVEKQSSYAIKIISHKC